MQIINVILSFKIKLYYILKNNLYTIETRGKH